MGYVRFWPKALVLVIFPNDSKVPKALVPHYAMSVG